MSFFSSNREIPETVVLKVNRASRIFTISICAPFVFLISCFAFTMWNDYEQTHVFDFEAYKGGIFFCFCLFLFMIWVIHKLRQASKISLTIHRPSRLFIYKDGDYEKRFFATGVGSLLYEGTKSYNIYIQLKSGEELYLPWQLNSNTLPGMSVINFLETYYPSLGIPAPRPKIFAKLSR